MEQRCIKDSITKNMEEKVKELNNEVVLWSAILPKRTMHDMEEGNLFAFMDDEVPEVVVPNDSRTWRT